MKESIGGTWLFTIVIVFIALFTTFVSVTTNYARCFKIKDAVIDKIEFHKGVNSDSLAAIREMLVNLGYSSTGRCPDAADWFGFSASDNNNAPTGYGGNVNFCIQKKQIVCPAKEVGGRVEGSFDRFPSAYYTVVIFFKLDWPILRQIFNIKITGETTIIPYPRDIVQLKDASGCE